jgi:putative ABC transport system permease protein
VLALLLAAGATFLLLACVNVLGLVAARRVDGRHDRSIRLALGASEGRLLRGSVVEGLVLAAVGSAAGVLGAYALVGPLRSLVPYHVPRLDDVAVTPPLAIGGLAAGAALGAVVGLCGYLASRGVEPAVGRAPMWRVVGTGGRRALVVGQVALTTLLIAGGAAIVQRVAVLSALDLGYDPEGVSTTSTILRDVPRNRHPEARWRFARAMLDALEQRGVLAAMAVNTPMMAGDDIPQLGIRADSASPEIVYEAHFVSPNYFAVMGIELLAGRDFGPDDRASSQPVVIVSEEFVQQYFGAGTPVQSVVGREIAPLIYQETRPTVVGVVRSTRHRGPEAPVAPEIYTPLSQLAVDAMTLVVRGAPEQVAGAVAAAATQVDAEQEMVAAGRVYDVPARVVRAAPPAGPADRGAWRARAPARGARAVRAHGVPDRRAAAGAGHPQGGGCVGRQAAAGSARQRGGGGGGRRRDRARHLVPAAAARPRVPGRH